MSKRLSACLSAALAIVLALCACQALNLSRQKELIQSRDAQLEQLNEVIEQSQEQLSASEAAKRSLQEENVRLSEQVGAQTQETRANEELLSLSEAALSEKTDALSAAEARLNEMTASVKELSALVDEKDAVIAELRGALTSDSGQTAAELSEQLALTESALAEEKARAHRLEALQDPAGSTAGGTEARARIQALNGTVTALSLELASVRERTSLLVSLCSRMATFLARLKSMPYPLTAEDEAEVTSLLAACGEAEISPGAL